MEKDKTKQNTKKFNELRSDIIKALQEKQEKKEIAFPEQVTLVDGFFMQSFQDTLGGGIELGGRSVPSIMLVGNNSGQIYYFALKVILPDLEF